MNLRSPSIELLGQNVDDTITANVASMVTLAVVAEVLIVLLAEEGAVLLIVVPATVRLGNLSV